MSNKALAIFILVGLVLVIVVMIWAARPQSGDRPRADFDARDEASWTVPLETGAAWVGGLFGKGPSEFAMSRLRDPDGDRAVPGCRSSTCRYEFSGTPTLSLAPDQDARYAKLIVRPIGRSVTVLFKPKDVEEEAERKTVPADSSFEMTVLDEGGELSVGCPQTETCAIEFSQGS
jgi:hypothetical protein